MQLWKRTLAVTVITVIGATAFYLHAEEKKPVVDAPAATTASTSEQKKLQEEFKVVRKDEYLKNVAEREKYYTTMAAEMKSIHKACAGEDKEACKAAREKSKTTREKLSESRKANSEQFKGKMDEYRKKLGKDAPTQVEKDRKELKAKKAE